MKRLFLILLFSFAGIFAALSQDSVAVDLTAEEFFFIDEMQLDRGGVFTFWDMFFKLGSYELIDSAYGKYLAEKAFEFMRFNEIRLLAIADYMQRHSTYIIEIGVHRDCRGSESMSTRLTPRRAQTIVEELVKLGVDKARLLSKGFGESEPFNDNGQLLTCKYISSLSKEEGEKMHQKNRRFQLRVISKGYVPVK